MRCCRVGYDMNFDFLTCNSDNDNDRRDYIGVDQRKMKKVIMIIDE